MPDLHKLIEETLSAQSESAAIEFKESFDPQSAQSWCEIVKDIVAMANTCSGVILFGLTNIGQPSGYDVSRILSIDPAEITNKIHKYTNQQFSGFQLFRCDKSGQALLAMVISQATLPIVFEKPGTYDIGEGRQRTAFGAGTVYFRHGAKSEPGNTEDIRIAFERRLALVREDWLKNVRQVIEAPLGAKVLTIQPDADATALGVRITDDPTAPTIGVLSPDVTHPLRQKDLIQSINQRLPDGVKVNQYDILCIRRLYKIDDKTPFEYFSRFGGRQYSTSLADWIIQQYGDDNEFFAKTRQKIHDSQTTSLTSE